MPYSIAFVGVDGAGKTTLIDKVSKKLELPKSHMNRWMKHLYWHQRSNIWEYLNTGEIHLRNKLWSRHLKSHSLLMDRCYICSLVYSEIEGIPKDPIKVRKWAVQPDIICLIEPVEELVSHAYEFTRKYKQVLRQEGYVPFRTGFHYFGRITFWKKPSYQVDDILNFYIKKIGSHGL